MSETRRGFSLQGEINDLYQQYLGRDAEQKGMDYWLGTFSSGATLADIERAIAASPEAQRRQGMLTQTVAADRTSERLAEMGGGYTQQYFPGQVSFGLSPIDTTKSPLEDFEWYKTFRELLNAYLADIEGQDSDDMDRVDRMNAANAWIDAMQTGNMDVIKNVDVSALEDMPGFKEYYSGIVGTTEDTQSTEQSLIEKYGKAVVDDFKQKYEDIVATVGKAADDPWAAIEGLISTTSNTKGPCWEGGSGGGGVYTGKEWVRNCVTVGVLVAIPGLPVPPIPGIVGATVGEIEDAVKTVGKTIGDFIEKPVDTIKEVAGDVWEGIQGIFEKGSDPKGIYDYVNGIFGSVMSGVIMNEIGDAVDSLFIGGDKKEEEETEEVLFEGFDPDRETIIDPAEVDLSGLEEEGDKDDVVPGFVLQDPVRETIVDPPQDDEVKGFQYATPCDNPQYAEANPEECGVNTVITGGDDNKDDDQIITGDKKKCENPEALNTGEEGDCKYPPKTEVDEGPDQQYSCDDPNATTRPDGSCGPCKAGYVFDGAVERCVQEEIKVTGTTTTTTTTPPPPPPPPETTPPPETGGGGGGGGGGSGMMTQQIDPFVFDIAGDPQLLAKLEFPVVDYLAQILPADVQQNVMKGLFEGMV